MSTRPRRPFWVMRAREARGHAILLAVILWIGAAILIFSRPGARDRLGHLKGADFVHFYTLGHLARAGEFELLYDQDAQHRRQALLVPASATDTFVPVYPPHTALLFGPLAWLPYGAAALMWALVTAMTYGLAVGLAWRPARVALSDRLFLVAAAVGFPPFWNLVLHGQTTAVVLLGFLLGWLALERRRRFLAGLAFGLLAIKPQFGLALAVVVLACGEWAMFMGALASIALQAGLVWLVMGSTPLVLYAETLRRLPQLASLLEPKPYQLHSIRAIAGLLPSWWGTAVWALLGAAVLVQTVRVWRTQSPVRVRLGILVIATVLVSPHLTVYDATVLALPLLWIGGWIESERRADLAAWFWPLVYWLYVTLLVPTALLIWIQISVLILAVIFFRLSKIRDSA